MTFAFAMMIAAVALPFVILGQTIIDSAPGERIRKTTVTVGGLEMVVYEVMK